MGWSGPGGGHVTGAAEWTPVGDSVNQLEMEVIIGNGSAAAGHRLLEAIARRVSEARRKHPVFAEGKYHALGVIGEEYQEVVQAVEKETCERMYQELLDLITTSTVSYTHLTLPTRSAV